ncbi:hypothetical protein [Micromonospora kangleipakensis]|uniref:hypothetical protein n=1 Tax=Micromonospora kangleipakensis TaxID=1077942 RepID=UPI001028E491|nr:hypothetical protein [Micromonospora kangleipakensis]
MTGRTRRRLAFGIIASCMACLLVIVAVNAVMRWLGDSRPELSNDIVVGVWQGAGGCELVLNDDGTFHASQIPVSLLGSEPPTSATTSGAGRWSVRAAVNDYSGRKTEVALVFESLDEFPVPYSVNLRSDSVDGKIVLFWFIGDPDLGRRFILERT